ncbi:MAG: response regulator [Magnetococcus sp. YQC-3]
MTPTPGERAKGWFRFNSLLFQVLAAGFVALLSTAISLHHSINDEIDHTMYISSKLADFNISKDLAFRHWATRHGGVYVPVDERTPPNQHLAHLPERDITTPSGKQLTLMNPAYMLRQIMDEHSDLYGTRGKITSLKPLNPANAPDPWEEKALRRLESGEEEAVMEVVGEGLDASLRLLRPMMTKKGCLKCHEHQGYKEGDMRGGISVKLPLRSFREAEAIQIRHLIIVHLLFLSSIIFLIALYYRLSLARERILSASLDNEERLRLTHTNALEAIITIDENGLVEDFNPSAEKLFGYAREVILGKDIADFIMPQEMRKAHKDALLRHSREKSSLADMQRKMELHGLCADGRKINLEVSLIGLHLRGKRYFTAFIRDVTERKQLLTSLEETLQVAESANRLKGEFLANMSHEIRTPMNTIIGMTDLTLTVPLSVEEQRRNLEIVLQSSQTLLGLINNILDFSKMDAGMITMERIVFDLFGQMENVCNTLAIKAHQKGLELYCHIAPQVPATLVGDPLRLGQVLTNLVNNAIKFTEEGEVVVRVELVLPSAPDGQPQPAAEEVMLHFAVADTGIGIPAEKISLIFDRFTQVDGSVTRKYGGTGLGLTISKHLVSLMGGEIGLQSTVGQGSLFHFSARFAVAQRTRSGTTGQEGEERQAAPAADRLPGMRVLLADSHATGRMVVREILLSAGVEVEEAVDPAAMLRKRDAARAEGRPFDLLLLDHGLLDMVPSPPAELAQPGGEREKLILLLPSHVSLESFAAIAWLQGARAARKPVFKFRLLKTIRQILGCDSAAGAAPADRCVAVRQGAPLAILLVEDSVDNQKLAVTILARAGHTVTIANHGLEALAHLREKAYDLVLMDLQMPEMDGMETTRQIRTADPGVIADPRLPIIAVTAKSTGDEERQCLEVGMDGYLRKPYRSQELLSIIEKIVLKRRQASRALLPAQRGGVLKDVPLEPVVFAEKGSAFIQNFPLCLEGLKRAIAQEELVQIGKWADRLSESAREIGAWKVSSQSVRLRGSAEMKNWEELPGAFVQLTIHCQEARQALVDKGVGI